MVVGHKRARPLACVERWGLQTLSRPGPPARGQLGPRPPGGGPPRVQATCRQWAPLFSSSPRVSGNAGALDRVRERGRREGAPAEPQPLGARAPRPRRGAPARACTPARAHARVHAHPPAPPRPAARACSSEPRGLQDAGECRARRRPPAGWGRALPGRGVGGLAGPGAAARSRVRGQEPEEPRALAGAREDAKQPAGRSHRCEEGGRPSPGARTGAREEAHAHARRRPPARAPRPGLGWAPGWRARRRAAR